jgi:hypothetical protein
LRNKEDPPIKLNYSFTLCDRQSISLSFYSTCLPFIQCSDKKLKKYMDEFIGRARSVVMVEDVKHAVEVFVMCVQCMEVGFEVVPLH